MNERRKLFRALALVLTILCVSVAAQKHRIPTQQKPQSSSPEAKNDQPDLVVQLGHTDEIDSVSYSPDGRFILSGGYPGIAILWDATNGRELRRFEAGTGSVIGVGFSSDTKQLFTVEREEHHNNILRLWDVSSGQMTLMLKSGLPELSCAAFSPDGKLIATGIAGETAILWNLKTRSEVRRFTRKLPISQSTSAALTYITFSPDGRFLLGGDGKTAQVWAVASEDTKTLGKEASSINAASFAPDGKSLYVGEVSQPANGPENGTVRMIDVASGNEIRQLWQFSARRGQLGISFRHVDSQMAQNLGKSDTKGIIVSSVLAGSAAERAGIRQGDVITALDGALVTETDAFRNRIASTAPGTQVTLTVLRDDREQEITATLGEFNSSFEFKFIRVSKDGRLLLFQTNISEDERLHVLKTDTGNEVARIPPTEENAGISMAEFSPTGGFVVTGHYGSIVMWDLNSNKAILEFRGYARSVQSAGVARNGNYIFSANRSETSIWDVNSGQEFRRFTKGAPAAISSDGHWLVAGDIEFNVKSDAEFKLYGRSQGGLPLGFLSVAFATDDNLFLSGHDDGVARLWYVAMNAQRYGSNLPAVTSVAFSPDNKLILTGHSDKVARLWDTWKGNQIRSFKGHLYADHLVVAYSPNGRNIATGSWDNAGDDNTALIWTVGGAQITRLRGHTAGINAISFSPDGRSLLTGSDDKTAILWDVRTGRPVQNFTGHSSGIQAVGFLSDGRYILTGSTDGTTRLWTNSGKEICRLISFIDGRWVVASADGRFDTNDLQSTEGLFWKLHRQSLDSVPLEIFMRDYYEPRLLPRLLKCISENNCEKEFRPVRNLTSLNRTQPDVKITEVSRVPNTDTVNVTVEVGGLTSDRQRAGQNQWLQSGVYDVRLFRDGQIVGSSQPNVATTDSEPKAPGEAELEEWRQTNRVKLDSNDKATITFTAIKLPHRSDTKEVEFSAYAFNSDRVKSRTDRKSFAIPPDILPKKGRAYIISVGVNAYENRDFDLEFAADDARRIEQTVSERLKATEQYEKVVSVSLLSDYEREGDQKITTVKQATKNNFKAVLQVLSKRGAEVDRKQLAGITNVEELQPATPDDLVLIMYSSHGYADRDGNFYFIPYDTGPGTGKLFTETVRQHSISSEELSLWLRDVDAGEMVMIVDACHSTAAVAGQEFKPGPMGSRGLGQLSYDKGMRILTATQTDNVAWEYPRLRQGVLTYALVHDAIDARQADFKPQNGVITLTEWLSYATTRVPTLYEEVRAGKVQDFGLAPSDQPKLVVVTSQGTRAASSKDLEEIVMGSNKIATSTQQPSLFDFARKRKDVVLAKTQ